MSHLLYIPPPTDESNGGPVHLVHYEGEADREVIAKVIKADPISLAVIQATHGDTKAEVWFAPAAVQPDNKRASAACATAFGWHMKMPGGVVIVGLPEDAVVTALRGTV